MWTESQQIQSRIMNPLEIKPGIGVGPIRLGMRPAEVLEVFEERQDGRGWYEGNLNGSIVYNDLRLDFDGCDSRFPLPDSRLFRIVVRPPRNVLLFGMPLGSWTKEELVKRFNLEGMATELLANGDVCVPERGIEISFDESARLVWFEM